MSGIYIHIPFCKQNCYYCDFHFSVSLRNKGDMLNAILKELELRKNEIKFPVETIYFGGGTPSLLSEKEIDLILNTIYLNYTITDGTEITLEANPDDLNLKKIKELYRSNINRLSIGIQSFFDDDLTYMNRSHNAQQALKSVQDSLNYFDNITMDLIYGIPDMSIQKWEKNLDITCSLPIPHLSAYALTVEKNTALDHFIKKGKYIPLDESLALDHFKLLMQKTKEHNLIQYEISNFGKEKYFSKHNTSYWTGKPYLGIGPSAHSFDGKYRSWNVSNNPKYIKTLLQNKLAIERELLSKSNHYNEYIMTNLRTIWGVSLKTIQSQFGAKYAQYLLVESKIHLQNKTLIKEGETLFLTKKGKFLADGIASDLFII